MDIHKWLAETVQPEAPPKLIENPNVKPSRHSFQPAPVTNKPRRRKQSRSDSSLLDVHLQSEEKPTAKRSRPVVEISDDSAESDTFHATHSELSESKASSQRYARQPRRKTRPERYQPLSRAVQERGKHAHQRRQDESKKSRHKSKRRKSNKQGSGIVQTFHAKNVSGDRLTLKPQEQLGIFNKGKTSRAIKGRGLPDLVFSEMKFLQKNNNQSDVHPQPETSRNKHKRDRAQAREGEISAFFTTVPSVLTETAGNTLPIKSHDEPRASRRGRERSSAIDAAIATVGISDKASSLKFGQRGSRRESSSYVSWSDSNRATSTAPGHVRTQHGGCSHQLDPLKCKGEKTVVDQEELSFKLPAPTSQTRQRSDRTAERLKVSSLASTHHRLSRSCSYPPQSSSPRQVNLVDRTAKLQASRTTSSSSSMPPYILANASTANAPEQARASPLANTNESSYHEQSISSREASGTNRDVNISSDLDRVVQECDNSFNERHRAVPSRHVTRVDPAYSTIEPERRGATNSYSIVQRVPTVRFVEGETRAQPMPNFAGSSIYEQQAQRERLPLQPAIEQSIFPGRCPSQEDYLEYGDTIDCGDRTYDGLTGEIVSHGLEEDLGNSGLENAYPPGGGVQQLAPESHVVAPGFWRPNRLY